MLKLKLALEDIEKDINMKKTKILFVCLGNICRSPLAHAVFENLVHNNGLSDEFEIESCGTGSWHVGEMPDSRMIAEAKKHEIKMEHLRGRTLQALDFKYYDLILAMDNSNLGVLLTKTLPEFKDKIKLFRTYDPKSTDSMAEVPDPYFGGAEGFSNVFDIVERTCENLLEELKKD